jgi:hypothetical protein
MAVDIGRLPSILGGLCFRARVSSYRLHTFEDAVIFVHDIERVFDRIPRPSMEIIAGVVLLEYSVPEAALRLGITVQRAERRYATALDSLSAALLEVGLLRPVFTSGPDGNPSHSLRPAEPLPPRKPPLPVRIEARPPASATGGLGASGRSSIGCCVPAAKPSVGPDPSPSRLLARTRQPTLPRQPSVAETR